MGVPSLFRQFVKLSSTQTTKIEYFFIDFNCLIHKCCKMHFEKGVSYREIDECVINEILRYTVYLVTKIVKPTRLLFISIDGSVPLAKMIKQRKRRFKYHHDAMYKQKLKNKYNITTTQFDSTKISPGTLFMSKLSARIKNLITIGAFSQHTQNFKVIFSDSNVPGEGEFKIFDYLKQNNIHQNILIYGMDADLIVLSMNYDFININLIRENDEDEIIYLNIKDCCTHLFNKFVSDDIMKIDEFVKDFILFSFLGGNDFVTAIPQCQIRSNGLEKLMRTYVNVYSELRCHLVIDTTINFEFLKQMMMKLSDSEDLAMKNVYNKQKIITKNTSYETDMENFEHLDYSHSHNPFHNQYKEEFKKINYKDEYIVWKRQYISEFFGDDDPVQDYIKSLLWTYDYYNGKIQDKEYCYSHRNAPLASMLSCVDLQKITQNISFTENDWLTPIEQLLYILPPQNCKLLPSTLQDFLTDDDSPLITCCPPKVQLDVLVGKKNIYSEPILPYLNVNIVKKIVVNVPLNEYDILRNTNVHQNFHKTFAAKKKLATLS